MDGAFLYQSRRLKKFMDTARPGKKSRPASTAGKVFSLLVVGGLLVLPGVALARSGVNFRWAGGYALAISALTFWMYARDKRRAQAGEWRVPEAELHFLELVGGWPGAWLGQRWLRHKSSKVSYQIVFWLIVMLWQFVAWDSLQNFQHSRAVWSWVEQTSGQRR